MLKTTLALSCMVLAYVYRQSFSLFWSADSSLDLWSVRNPLYTACPEKKTDQNVSCNILHKTRAILMKFGSSFPE